MKILLVHPHLDFYGGAELVINNFASILQKKNHQCAIVTLSSSKEFKKKLRGVKFFLPQKQYGFQIRGKSLVSALGLIKEIFILRNLIKKVYKDYDVINVHNFPTTWAVAGLPKPIVWMCNEPPDLWTNPNPNVSLKLIRYLGIKLDIFIVRNFIKKIVVADQNNADYFIKRYGIKPEIINYGIDYQFFSKSKPDKELTKKYGLDNKFIVIQVGVLTPQKNQLESLKAIKNLRNEIKKIKIVLAGNDKTLYGEKLKNYVSENKMNDNACFTGQLHQELIKSLYASSDVAVFPIKVQGGWLSPFEALSAGVPIVVYPTMGAASIISKNNLGIVSKDLSKSILTIFKNYNKLDFKQNLEKSQKWIRNNLTWEKFTEQMLNIFKEGVL